MTHPKLAVARSGWGGRGYAIPGRTRESPKTGKPLQLVYPSVTTVLRQIRKPGIEQWIADQTAAFAVTNLSYLMAVSDEVAWGGLRFKWRKEANVEATELRRYYDGVKEDAADLGTNIHEWIEAELDGLSPYPDLYAVETEHMVDAFGPWLAEHEVISHNQEFTIVNDELGVAGTADGDWTVTCLHAPRRKLKNPETGADEWHYCLGTEPGPHRTLIDLKSSRHLWRENGYQLAALDSGQVVMREVLETTPGAKLAKKTEKGVIQKSWWVEDAPTKFERYALLHIRPDDLDTKGEQIPRYCKLVDRSRDMDLYRMGFEGALALAKSEKQEAERMKARGIETEEYTYGTESDSL